MVGCGDDDTGTEDTGTEDTGTPDAGEDTNVGEDTNPPPEDTGTMTGAACDSVRTETLAVGEQTISGNTADGGSLTLTNCGGPEAGTLREVIAVEIPGSGVVGVTFTTGTAVTGETDTVVQVRPAGCADETDAVCFDDEDTDGGIFYSTGGFNAMGGETVHLVVTTFPTGSADAPEPGPEAAWSMDLNVVADPAAPVLTGGTVSAMDGDALAFSLMGTDAGADVVNFTVTFLDDAGEPIEVDEDGDPATEGTFTEFLFAFDEDVSGMTEFTAVSNITGVGTVEDLEGFAALRVALVDVYDLRSETMDFTPTTVTTVGFGEACDGEMTVCPDTLECIADTCQAPAAVTEACDALTPVALTAGTPVTQTVSIAAGDGLFGGSCGLTGGAEGMIAITVPAGDFDLEVTTDNETNGMVEDLDTVLYLRTVCADEASEPEAEDAGCNDDIESGNTLSTLTIEEAPEGTHTVFVELYGGIDEGEDPQDVEVTISLTAR